MGVGAKHKIGNIAAPISFKKKECRIETKLQNIPEGIFFVFLLYFSPRIIGYFFINRNGDMTHLLLIDDPSIQSDIWRTGRSVTVLVSESSTGMFPFKPLVIETAITFSASTDFLSTV